MRRLIAALAILAIAVAFVGAPSVTHAADNPKTNREQALELFKQSRKRYESGDFTGAIELLERAYALEPSPVLQFNLGRAYESAGQLDKAIEAYKKYLELDPKAKDRGAIEQRIDTLERQLADRAHLARERDEAAQRAKEAERKRESQTEPDGKTPASSPNHPNIAPIIVIAAGAAVLTTGGIFGYLSRQKNNDAQDTSTSGKQADDDHASAKRFATIANVGFIAGGVLVAGGAIWLIIGSSSKEAPGQVSLGLMPNGARVSGKF